MTIDRTVVPTTVSRSCAAAGGQIAARRGRAEYLTVIGVNGVMGVNQAIQGEAVSARG